MRFGYPKWERSNSLLAFVDGTQADGFALSAQQFLRLLRATTHRKIRWVLGDGSIAVEFLLPTTFGKSFEFLQMQTVFVISFDDRPLF